METVSYFIVFLLNGLIFISCNAENSVEKEPETTTPKVKTEKVPIEKIEEGIRQYITETTEKSGGIFNIVDDTLDLNLRLVRVHTEYLSHLGPRSFFAYVDLADDQFNNKSLYLELDESHSHKEISIAYRVKRLEKNPYPAEDGESLEQYLKSNTLIPVDDRFKEIALTAIGNKTKNDPLIKARALYDYVIDSVKYIKAGTYGTGDAVYACDAQSGNCTEFHSFFIALARSVDIPARFAIGASIPSDRNEGGIEILRSLLASFGVNNLYKYTITLYK